MKTLASIRIDLDLGDALHRRFHPDAVILEEDRYLRMASIPAVDLDPGNDLDAAYVAIRKQRPLPLGRYLLLRPGSDRPSWTYQAVVHDLEFRPSCRPGDVRRALIAIVENALSRGFLTLGMALPGIGEPGSLALSDVLEALDSAAVDLAGSIEKSVRLVVLFDEFYQLEAASNLLRATMLRRAQRSFRNLGEDVAIVDFSLDGQSYQAHFVPGSSSGYVLSRVRKRENREDSW